MLDFVCITARRMALPLLVFHFVFVLGCGGAQTGPVADPPREPAKQSPITTTRAFDEDPRPAVEPTGGTTSRDPVPSAGDKERSGRDVPPQPGTTRITKMAIDESRVAANGIRKIAGRHLVLYTDLPLHKDIDELPTAFDQAVPQWCEYFEIPVAKAADWQMQGFLMKDPAKFQAAGLLPAGLPRFLHGYNQGFELWVNEQESPYYRRHLLLHEGTHGFMDTMLGGMGPPWYAEGMAELLGTHRWQDEKLTLRHNPRSKEEAVDWGRVRLLRDRLKARAGKPYTLEEVMELGPTAHRQVEPYAWCWAAAFFFDSHPEYRDWFRALKTRVKDNSFQFNEKFRAAIRQDRWKQAEEQWRLFMDEVDYGYDVTRAAVQFQPGEPLSVSGATVSIQADRGWQSTGVYLREGMTYQITASGRYQVGDQPKIWWCEPGGVTIHYYRGRPLGMLMAAVRDDVNPNTEKPHLARAAPIGLNRQITPAWSGTLYLKINESPKDLADNAGELTVKIGRPD